MALVLPISSGLLTVPFNGRGEFIATCSSRRAVNLSASTSCSSTLRSEFLHSSIQVRKFVVRKHTERCTVSNSLAGERQGTSGFRELKMDSGLSEAGRESSPLPEGATPQDAEYMRMAVELARKAVGHTSPNPMVGCVIVKDGQIVGRGFHPKAGEPHAEVFALREAGKAAQGATAYVSLEPCNHTGRTPPCSQALVRARVGRVVVGTVDPNPLVGGKGVQTLQKAGIKVVVGVEEALCQATAEAFFHRIVTKKPFVSLRYTISMDGAVLRSQGTTSAEAGSNYSILLQENDAVIVTDKCILGNPKLLSSEAGAKQPLRVVVAKSLALPLDSHVFDTSSAPTLVITDANAISTDLQSNSRQSAESMESLLRSRGVDVVAMNEVNLDAVLDLLYQKGLNSVLLDSTLCNIENYLGPLALSEQGPQKVVAVISPVLVGNRTDGPGFQFEDDNLKLERVTTKTCGGVVIVEGYVSKRPVT
ncbi:diaminohydroxyphosphoribosylaminopyrimidine deaminase / 5-amino-6-(5-phosphoribosylamino)uracil reductase [Marchantia polymorpha subsp. ruderalis]|nr:hypothetical protein MARPO_0008s0021 [Marchantia polymorpha]BBN19590.1 hypothetical protein Mp_8g11940 [Marchantia polymorpha subsp. ruderalis]PTQ47232.1 hypothetical protein MARPO_0008s0021 [Marchantia polymorpha]PTQ47233.1 hypothetical protein MARPO_0008s0021 [Marchantia polymorpha]BBN19591.1 hypothetical protein Mp_8g11940 [Marchantia polymorpha subsp. ruderalis]|eukprot:PTQ47231.1 hypothetical protein MARPO_0008s0021 [Marchantia polymorpha]